MSKLSVEASQRSRDWIARKSRLDRKEVAIGSQGRSQMRMLGTERGEGASSVSVVFVSKGSISVPQCSVGRKSIASLL
jgi:hypothetical protein